MSNPRDQWSTYQTSILKFLFPGQHIPAVDLRPAGDPWQDVMPPGLFRSVPGEIFFEQRAGSNQAHLSSGEH